jgi:hypothetical protein
MEKNRLKEKFRHLAGLPSDTVEDAGINVSVPADVPHAGNSLYADLLHKKEKLSAIAAVLKAHFIGLDTIVDELIGLISSWYFFPQAQLRPMVVNLWGMTGSGKTALVRKLVELLECENTYIQIDMGEFESDSAAWFKKTLTGDMDYLHGKPCIMCLDEFQFARTLDRNGNELGKDKLRFVWDLVDNGKLTYIPETNAFYQKRAEVCLALLLKARELGVVIDKGAVVENTGEFSGLFRDFYFESYGRGGNPMDANYFLSDDFVSGVYYLSNDDFTVEQSVRDEVMRSDLEGIAEIILKALETRNATRELDLSKALIFILGNLDEAYGMSHSMNPDISADELHEATLRINITDIKSALKLRFRPEQIARLGNNHLIYRAFRNAHFEELIRRELDRVAGFIRSEFGFEIVYHSSIHELIYNEGVFPAQGTRPVLTTVRNYIESWFGHIVIQAVDRQLPVAAVGWSYANAVYRFEYRDPEGNAVAVSEAPVRLRIESLRTNTDRNLQAHTAVHEAGHAVLAVLTLRILPSVIVSKSAADNADGFCMVNLPQGLTTRETLRKDIVISLGGYVAEKMIFGEEHTSSGVSGDIVEATSLANAAIRQYAMGSDPVTVASCSSADDDVFYMTDKYREEALKLIRECEKEAERLLDKHRLLLLKISEYLVDHYRMDDRKLAEYVRAYCDEDWVNTSGFRTKENYFAFEQTIRDQLAALERKQDNA